MKTTRCSLLVVGLTLTALASNSRLVLGQEYIASPAKRAALLEEVEAEEAKREALKENGPAVTLVKAGQPEATIIARDDAQKAAELLNEWLKLMSGTELPVAAAPEGAGPFVFLGQTALRQGLDLSGIESKTDEAVAIRCDGTKVLIGWQSGASPYRAVGRFLEEGFGCRYYSYEPWGRVFPERKTLKVHLFELNEKPTVMYRRIWGPEGAFRGREGTIWNQWNGNGGRAIAASHDWNFLSKEDFEGHPEWFRMDKDGQRQPGHWPNMGNEEVRRKFIQHAIEKSDHGRVPTISLSPPDNIRYDYSPEARRYDNPDAIVPSTGRVSLTDRFMGIVNEAAKAVYEQGKNTIIGFYAYSDYTMPPTRAELRDLSPNLCVMIAPIRFSRFHPIGHPDSSSRQRLKRIIDGWADCAEMLGYRTYNYNLAEIMTPLSKISIWSHDMPYLARRGCIAFNLESIDAWELYAPHLWLSIRLAYDPTQDPWKLMAEYWHYFYGPAARQMEDYWLAVDDAWINCGTESGSIHALPQVFTTGKLAQLDRLLSAAESAASKDSPYATRVALARRGLDRAQLWRRWYDSANEGRIKRCHETLEQWWNYVSETIEAGNGNKYDLVYIRRFVKPITLNAYQALYPENKPDNRLVTVLPETWRYRTGAELKAAGINEPWHPDLNDEQWHTVATYSATLNAQGFADEYFGDMWYRTTIDVPAAADGRLLLHFFKADRKITLYINGKQVNDTEREAFHGATIDASGLLKPGVTNHMTVKVRHIPLPELFLGGLVGPVYLIEEAD